LSVVEFRDDNQTYLAWVTANPDGFVVNIQRSLNPGDARLHRATCHWIRDGPPRGDSFVGAYIKVCSLSLAELGEWARSRVGSSIRDCGTCQPTFGAHDPATGPGRAGPPPAQEILASSTGTDPQHEFEGPGDDDREVRLWADRYIPFERLAASQRAARTELQRRVRLLSARPGEILHASYAGHKPGNADVENLLLYNMGGGCFQDAARHGVRFELADGHQRKPPSGRSTGCSYRHRLIERGDELDSWRRARLLASFTAGSFGRFPVSSLLALTWLAVHRGTAQVADPDTTPSESPFGVFLVLRHPGAAATWPRPELVKQLIDGVVTAFQAHRDLASVAEVSARIGAVVGESPAFIGETLLDQRQAVLGSVDHLVRLFGPGVQWNPGDHMCVAGEVVLESATGDTWQLSGEVCALVRR
jgi:hypothetical protein